MNAFQKIGVWQTAFLGDAILTLPLLQSLNAAYPAAELHFFVRGGLAGLFAGQPNLSSVTAFDKRGAQQGLGAAWRFGRELSRQDFDLWISPHTSLRSALVARAVASPVRIGYQRPCLNRLAYTHTVDRRFAERAEIERLMGLLEPLDIRETAPWPELILPDAAHARAQELLNGLPRPLLGMHPGSTWPTKKWPLEYYADVARRALQAGAGVAVFAGPGEEADAAAVVRGAGGESAALRNLAGKPDLPTLAACLKRLDTYLTNDSGPMHLAWVQRTPTLALFGPTVRSLGFFPRGPEAEVLEVDGLDCRPCGLHGHKQCPQGHFRCMRELTPEQTWSVLVRKLGLEAQSAPPASS